METELSPLELARLQWKQKTAQPVQSQNRVQSSIVGNLPVTPEPKAADRNSMPKVPLITTTVPRIPFVPDKNHYAPNPHLLTHLKQGANSQAYSVFFGAHPLPGTIMKEFNLDGKIQAEEVTTDSCTTNASATASFPLSLPSNASAMLLVDAIACTILIPDLPFACTDALLSTLLSHFDTVAGGIFGVIPYSEKAKSFSLLLQFNTYKGFQEKLPVFNHGQLQGIYFHLFSSPICVLQIEMLRALSDFEQIVTLQKLMEKLNNSYHEQKQKESLEESLNSNSVLHSRLNTAYDMIAMQQQEIELLRFVITGMTKEVFSISNQRPLKKRLLPRDQLDSLATSAEEEEAERDRVLIAQLLNEDRRRLQEELDKKTYPCGICLEDNTISDVFVLDGCYHKFCRKCLSDWASSRIQEAEVSTINCPERSCHQIISHNEIQLIVKDPEMLRKYEDFTLQQALEKMTDIRWCPKPSCGMAMVGGDGVLMMRCPRESCGFCFCYRCKEPWHADSTCEQYQAWKRDNQGAHDRFRLWLSQNAKCCPQCNAPIEKNGGCNHMTCAKCRHQFCWLCLDAYDSNHFGERTGCLQFT